MRSRLTISPLRDQTGEIVGASKILRDVTERKRIERELQELLAERNQLLASERAARSEAERLSASKDEFLALLSHELRTPLNAILGWTQILRSGSLASANFEKGLGVIERNVRAQTQLVDDLLDMSRIISGQMRLEVQPVMPYAFVQGAIESARPAADARGVRLEATLDPASRTCERRCESPATGRLELDLQRNQIHAQRRPRAGHLRARKLEH